MLSEILNKFEPVSLELLNNKAGYLTRESSKFILNSRSVADLLEYFKDDYNVLEINNKRVFGYSNLYYDTREFLLYNQHRAGKLNRTKVRKRTYLDSDLSMLEVKKKTNKGRTVKYKQEFTTLAAASEMIKKRTALHVENLTPVIGIDYKRISLLHKTNIEKVTIDIGLDYTGNNRRVNYNNVIILEIKTGDTGNSVAKMLMKNLGIRPDAVSKYCLGLISVNKDLKYNNFKPVYNKILKTNEHGILHVTGVSFY